MPGQIARGSKAMPVAIMDDDGNYLGSASNPLNITGGGGGGGTGGAVTIADGADVALGTTTNAAYSDTTGAATGTVVGLLKGFYTGIKGLLTVQGTVAGAATASGNPVGVGAIFNTTLPLYTAAQRSELQSDARGGLRIKPTFTTASGQDGLTFLPGFPASDTAATTFTLPAGISYLWNGSNYDRQRGDATGTYSVNTASGAAAAALTVTTAVNAFSLVVKNAAGNFFGGSIVAGATAGYLISYNAAAAPTAGNALTATLILGVVQVAANGSAALGDYVVPDRASAGVVLLFSTSLTTYTQPANAAQFLRGRAV